MNKDFLGPGWTEPVFSTCYLHRPGLFIAWKISVFNPFLILAKEPCGQPLGNRASWERYVRGSDVHKERAIDGAAHIVISHVRTGQCSVVGAQSSQS